MKDARGRRWRWSSAAAAPLATERVPLAEAAGRVAAEGAAAPSTCRRSTARRWTASRSARPTPRRRRAAAGRRRRGGRRRARDARRRAPPRGSPPARRSRRAPTRSCTSSDARSTTARVAADAGAARRHCTSASAARTSTPATCSRRPATPLTLARVSALASAGRRRGRRAPPRRACTARHRLASCCRSARRPSRARSTSPTALMVRLLAERAGAQVDRPRRDRRRLRRDPRRGRGRPGRRRAARLRRRVASARTTTSSPPSRPCGVDEVFWRVRIKPGKPLWFGRRGVDARVRPAGQPALERSSASALFIVPALRRLQGERDAGPRSCRGRLDRGRRPVRRPHDVPDLAARARRRRRARGDADRAARART